MCYASETVTSSVYSLRDNSASTFSLTDDDVANGLVYYNFKFNTSYPWGNVYNGNYTPWMSPLTSDVIEFSAATSSYDSLQTGNYRTGMHFYVNLKRPDDATLISKGDAFNLQLTGLKHQMRYTYKWQYSVVNGGGGSGGGVAYYPYDANSISSVDVEFVGHNGEWTNTSFNPDDVLKISGDNFGVDLDIVAPDWDVARIVVLFICPLDGYHWSVPDASSYHNAAKHTGGTGIYFQTVIENGILKITTPDENSGLLRSIIEWLRNIRDGITNVFESITALPARIWSFIEEGLKSFFVPSADDIVAMKDQWDTLLSDRFGVVYQSGTLIVDTVKTITAQAGNPNIEFPQVSYNFSGTEFTFGGYNVQVVPTGFEFLADVLKTVIDIVVTLAFVNGMRNKYDELMMR